MVWATLKPICITTLAAVLMIGCQAQTSIDRTDDTPTPQQPSFPSPKEKIIPDTGNVEGQQSPAIIAVTFPETVESGGNYAGGAIHYRDAQGDIHSAQFTLVEGGCMDFEFFAVNPMDYISSGDRFEGAFRFQQACRKCAESTGDTIVMRVQLYDQDSNESAPLDYTFLCQ